TWCPPCRAEMPEIEAVYQKYREKGVEVIGVDILEPVDTVRQFVQRGGFTWTFVLDTTGRVTAEYAIAALPTTYFIDREGIIRVVNVGAMTEKSIEARLRELLD
ncbi:MAG: TlpA family protein disulfide reductase, partial [Chloroflexi bacterium]|nr:TlpA family protein disulfide reductase [Chloroflexota bacterium]